MDVHNVFKVSGFPNETYVSHAEVEKQMRFALSKGGVILCVTGLSKMGKTTLCENVLSELNMDYISLPCTRDTTVDGLWIDALNKNNYEYVEGKKRNNTKKDKLGSKLSFGISFLKTIFGGFHEASEGIESQIKVAPSSLGVSQVKESCEENNRCLIIDDFHNLPESEREKLFANIRVMCGGAMPVILVAAAHHKTDLVQANSNLRGRVSPIKCVQWSTDTLAKIAEQGFNKLKLHAPPSILDKIAKESVGVPFLTQTICLRIANYLYENHEELVSPKYLFKALEDVARYDLADEDLFNEELLGLNRSGKRPSKFCLILLSFRENENEFQLVLAEDELCERMGRIGGYKYFDPDDLRDELKYLDENQKNYLQGQKILGWSEERKEIYLYEPQLLLYIKWREHPSQKNNSFLDSIASLMYGVERTNA